MSIITVTVCVGSSCHLKGSYDVIKRLEKLIKDNDIEDNVNLKASFCLGCCTDGVAAMVGQELLTGLRQDNVEKFFKQEVLGRLGQ